MFLIVPKIALALGGLLRTIICVLWVFKRNDQEQFMPKARTIFRTIYFSIDNRSWFNPKNSSYIDSQALQLVALVFFLLMCVQKTKPPDGPEKKNWISEI